MTGGFIKAAVFCFEQCYAILAVPLNGEQNKLFLHCFAFLWHTVNAFVALLPIFCFRSCDALESEDLTLFRKRANQSCCEVKLWCFILRMHIFDTMIYSWQVTNIWQAWPCLFRGGVLTFHIENRQEGRREGHLFWSRLFTRWWWVFVRIGN